LVLFRQVPEASAMAAQLIALSKDLQKTVKRLKEERERHEVRSLLCNKIKCVLEAACMLTYADV
jgi:hypothetical protein